MSFRQVTAIPMGTNCAPLLADVFLYLYENEFLDNMIRSGHRRPVRLFNLCYRYIDDLIAFSNKMPYWTFGLTGLGPLMTPPGAPNKVNMVCLMQFNDVSH